jgi:hypothetical protein
VHDLIPILFRKQGESGIPSQPGITYDAVISAMGGYIFFQRSTRNGAIRYIKAQYPGRTAQRHHFRSRLLSRGSVGAAMCHYIETLGRQFQSGGAADTAT